MTTPYPYESATPEQKAIGSPWWCIHHAVKLELLTEPIEERATYILHAKAEHERETRLRAMRPVIGALPPALAKAYEDWRKAGADWLKANEDWQKACADWQKAYADHASEIDALFAVECADVPWGPDGLIFPEVKP